ncbi:hypothetical protein [Sanguibacter sp. 25GB23B1]|uniref:hypothetical protein n=1 Tax=unclassified Sanguibacter TaxID=2645534 RepID=UPI0032AEFFB3
MRHDGRSDVASRRREAIDADLHGLTVADRAGANAQIGLDALLTVLDLVQRVAFPLGASLVGAAVVIQTLAPARLGAERATSDTP